jgi:GNAT superfamily N-acetyltransferase
LAFGPFRLPPCQRDDLDQAAWPEDVNALAQLRLANAKQHVGLDPSTQSDARPGGSTPHYHDRLSNPGQDPHLIQVAELASEVVGMAEIVIAAEFPDHQIAVPRVTAEIHTVVLDGYRGRGIGKALVRAGERKAAELSVAVLIAPILTRNAGAMSFYTAAGFGERGVLLSKELRQE